MTKDELFKKIDDFVTKYKDKTKGYPTDSSFNGECLSITKLCIHEVFGINAPPSGSNSAYGYWTNFPSPLPTLFKKVQNTPTNIPFKGCIPIWNTSVGGGYGHISIFISGDVNAWTGFEQNWNGRHAHLQAHDYSNIVGWLEPILEENVIIPIDDMPKWLTDLVVENGQNSDNFEGWFRETLGKAKDYEGLKKTVDKQAESIKKLTDRLLEQEGEIQTLTRNRVEDFKKIEKLQTQLASGEPQFSNSLAQWFYALAKKLG